MSDPTNVSELAREICCDFASNGADSLYSIILAALSKLAAGKDAEKQIAVSCGVREQQEIHAIEIGSFYKSEAKLRAEVERWRNVAKSYDDSLSRKFFEELKQLQSDLARHVAALKVAREALAYGANSNVNGYDFAELMEATKKLIIKNGGFQNAYAMSQAVETQQRATIALQRIDKELMP